MATAVTRRSASLPDDVRGVTWWVLVGAGAGALAGVAVGGVGGRLAMLLLRLTSPDLVVGMTSDDGFEIGVVSTRTLDLLLATAGLGALNGVLYATLRGALPARLRLPLWTVFAGALGGAAIVHEDGVDFTFLEPAALAIALFVALPGAAAAVVVVLVERWSRVEPWAEPRLALGVCAAALLGTAALAVAALVAAGALVVRRARLDRLAARIGRVLVPTCLLAATGLSLWELVTTSARIL
jgi:hypothetical protein